MDSETLYRLCLTNGLNPLAGQSREYYLALLVSPPRRKNAADIILHIQDDSQSEMASEHKCNVDDLSKPIRNEASDSLINRVVSGEQPATKYIVELTKYLISCGLISNDKLSERAQDASIDPPAKPGSL